jgi:Flp pilus assembly protein TadG
MSTVMHHATDPSKQSGMTLAVVAVVITVFLLLCAFLIDIASGLAVRNRLQVMSDTAADAGMVALGDYIVQLAEAERSRYPRRWRSETNPLRILTNADRQALLVSGRGRVESAIRANLSQNQAANRISVSTVEITYPVRSSVDCSSVEGSSVQLRLRLATSHPLLFESLWRRNRALLDVTSLQLMRVCP